MPHTRSAVQVGGAWLAIASFFMIAVLGFHGPIAPDLDDQMTRISDAAVSGLVVLTSQSRLTDGWWTMTAWALIAVGALWTMTTAVAACSVGR